MTIRTRALFVIPVALMLAGSRPIRAEEETAATTSGSVGAGVQGLREDPPDAAKFFEYRDVPGGFVLGRFELSWTPQPLFYFDLDAIDVSQDDTRGDVEFGRRDLWKGTIFWNDNPRRWGDGTASLFSHRQGARFTLDDALQSAVQAAPASVDTTPMDGEWDAGTKGFLIKSAIQQSSQDVDLAFQRRAYGIGLDVTPTRSWIVGAGWSRESRSGTTPQPLGNYFSLSPAEVAAPVEFRTDWESVRAEYHHRRFHFGVQLGASQFRTQHDTLIWDNQLSLVDQPVSATLTSVPGRERLTLWTDNAMVQGTLFGGVSLPRRTRVDLTVSLGQVTQDDDFLPMTLNGNLQPLLAPLPEESFDGEHRNALVHLRASGRPLSWLRWSAWGRWQELENESPSLTFPEYVQTDYAIPLCSNANSCGATTNRIARRSLPYGFERDNLGALAGFRPLRWLDVSVSYERQGLQREFSAVEDSDEDIWKVTTDLDLLESLTLRATAQTQRRRADAYDAHYFEESFPIGEANVAAFNEGMRRFIWTDRDRDAASLFLEWELPASVSLYAETTYARSDYLDPDTGRRIGDSFTVMEDRNFDTVPETYDILLAGRRYDRNNTYTLGAAWQPHARTHFYADYTWERFRYALETRYRAPSMGIGSDNPLDNWGSDAVDDYETWTAGVDLGLTASGTWRLGLSGTLSRGTGDITTDFVPGGAASGDTTLTEFPQLDTKLTIATLDLTHRVRPNLDYTLRYWYEDWNEDNWASDQMRQYMGDPGNDPGSVTSIYLGMDFDSYTYHVLSWTLNYRW